MNDHPIAQLIERADQAINRFRKGAGDRWLCAIDNSYGHGVLDATA